MAYGDTYERALAQLRSEVRALPLNAPLPSVRALLNQLGISLSTMERCLNSLESEGLITRVPRKGIFVGGKPADIPARSRLIGLVLSHMRSLFGVLLLQEIEANLQRNGYNLVLCGSEGSIDREIKSLRSLEERRVEGVILNPGTSNVHDPAYRSFFESLERRRHLPLVVVENQIASLGAEFVGLQNYEAGRKLAEMLGAMKNREIIFICPENSVQGLERLSGFRAGLPSSNPARMRVVHLENESARWHAQFKSLALGSTVTIVNSHPGCITALLSALRARKLSVPRDCFVASFVEEDYLEYVEEPIVAVRKPSRRMGRIAVERILTLIENKRAQPQTLRLPLRIVVPPEIHDAGF